jgi:hypothetical protein
MRTCALILAVLVMSVGLAVSGQSPFHADGATEGKTVLWFLGTEITIDVDGTVSLEVAATIDDDPIILSVEGTTCGTGVSDSYSLETTLWILLDAVGAADDGRPARVRGGLRLIGDEVDFDTLSLGAGSGTFVLALEIADETHLVTGTLSATAAGDFVPPEEPGSMQVEGGGTFTFNGDVVVRPDNLSEALPWDAGDWPEELLGRLLAVLDGAPLGEPSSDTP